jgi:glycosyltransferase involved in cell wall biosynthesis
MHILFLTDNFPPEVNAPASRTHDHCQAWVAAGHQVTVITCAPNFPKGEVFAGYRNRLWQSEVMDGIRVIRVWSYITRNEGFTKRILDYVSYMVTAFFAALFVRRVDVIVGTSPQFFTACAAYAVSVVKWRPWIFELRDIWPESIRAVSAMKQERLLDMLEKLELFLYRRASAVVSVTHAFKRNLIERGIDGNKISVITNGVNTTRFLPGPKHAELETRLGLNGKFVAGYIGTHGMAHGLETLVEAACLLKAADWASDVRILMLGDGANRSALETMARERGAENMLFLSSVPKDEVASYWSLLDLSIIHLADQPLFETVIPSKIFECMGMGIPVLHGVRGESAEIVTSNGIGLTFAPGSADDLVAQLAKLHSDSALRLALAQQGPQAAVKYDRQFLAMRMLDVIKGVVREG